MVPETLYNYQVSEMWKKNCIIGKGHNFKCFCHQTVEKFARVAGNSVTPNQGQLFEKGL